MFRKNIIIIVLSLAAAALTMFSCDEEVSESKGPTKLFRPVMFTAQSEAGGVSFWWTPIARAYYELDICRSQDFDSDVTSIFIGIEGTESYRVTDLYNSAQYFARIRSVCIDDKLESSGYSEVEFTTLQENILFEVSPDDIGEEFIRLSWDSDKTVTHFTVAESIEAPVEYSISAGEKANGRKEFTDLLPGTMYTFTIYNGDNLRGERLVLTADKPFDAGSVLKNAEAPFAAGELSCVSDQRMVLGGWIVNEAASGNGNVMDRTDEFGGRLFLASFNQTYAPHWCVWEMVNGKMYQTAELPAGTYKLTAYIYRAAVTNSIIYMTAALGNDLPNINVVEQNSLSSTRFTTVAAGSNTPFSIEFTLLDKAVVSMGFVATIVNTEIYFNKVELEKIQ